MTISQITTPHVTFVTYRTSVLAVVFPSLFNVQKCVIKLSLGNLCDIGYRKVGIITIGTWYKALWSPNLIQNHNKKEFHTSFEINLFWGNVPLCNALQSYQMTQIHKKKPKIIFSGQKLIKMYNLYQKMVDPHYFPVSFNFSDPRAYITYIMLLYLPWLRAPEKAFH